VDSTKNDQLIETSTVEEQQKFGIITSTAANEQLIATATTTLSSPIEHANDLIQQCASTPTKTSASLFGVYFVNDTMFGSSPTTTATYLPTYANLLLPNQQQLTNQKNRIVVPPLTSSSFCATAATSSYMPAISDNNEQQSFNDERFQSFLASVRNLETQMYYNNN